MKPRKRHGLGSAAEVDVLEDNKDEFLEQKELVMLDRFQAASSTDGSSESEEEILGLELTDDDCYNEEESYIDENGAPSRAWGQTKSSFYSRGDKEDLSSDEGAELEEKEAIALQNRLATALSEADYEAPATMETESIMDDVDQEELSIPQDLSKLSKEEVQTLLAKKSPELFELLEKFDDTLSHVLNKVLPAAEVARQQSEEFTEKEKKFLEANLHLHLCYCVNIMFYLLMKSSQAEAHSHPVIGSLYKLRQMLSYMSRTEQQLKLSSVELMKISRLKSVDQKAESSTKLVCEVTRKPPMDSVTKDPLEYYEHVKIRKQSVKKNTAPDKLLTHDNQGADHEEEGTKRAITFQIARNKGLIPKRRKEQRNPRVKHRKKFQKAIVKRKSQVLPVTTELYKYAGEASGIRSHLTRSVKIM